MRQARKDGNAGQEFQIMEQPTLEVGATAVPWAYEAMYIVKHSVYLGCLLISTSEHSIVLGRVFTLSWDISHCTDFRPKTTLLIDRLLYLLREKSERI